MENELSNPSLEYMSDKIENHQNYSGFWIRFVAVSIDVVLFFAFLYLLNIFTNYLYFYYCGIIAGHIVVSLDLHYETGKTIANFIAGLGVLIVWWLYFVSMTYKFGATFGKMVLKIKVVSVSFDTVSWWRIILREVIGKYLYLFLYGVILIGAMFYLTSDLNNSGLEPAKYFKTFGTLISFIIAIISYSMAGFTRNKQALHDKIAGTVVLCNRTKA